MITLIALLAYLNALPLSPLAPTTNPRSAASSAIETTNSKTDFESAMLLISGASCIEELSEDQLDHFQSLYEHPIELNFASRSRLIASTLLSPYQVASLLQYISENGELLSYKELSLVDGFNEQFVQVLRHFTAIHTRYALGSRPRNQLKQSATIAASLRESKQSTQRIKYSAELDQRAALLYSTRSTYSDPQLGLGTISAAYYGKRHLSQLLLGHYSARFGQGLLQWSGMQLNGYSSINAFCRNGRGLSTTSSALAKLFGVAADFQLGTFNLSLAQSFNELNTLANLSYHSPRLSLGASASFSGASIDWRYSLPSMSLYGEAGASYKAEGFAQIGLLWVPEYGKRMAVQARYFDPIYKQYSGLALGIELPSFFASIDGAYRIDKRQSQYKALLTYDIEICKTLSTKLRWSGRYRPADKYSLRNDTRIDLILQSGIWKLSARFNALWCRDFAYLTYIQAGPKNERFELSLRLSYHDINYWEDRIYVYQQDAPGSFDIPAFYKKGLTASIYSAWHINSRHSLWLRLSHMLNHKEVKLQYRIKF